MHRVDATSGNTEHDDLGILSKEKKMSLIVCMNVRLCN